MNSYNRIVIMVRTKMAKFGSKATTEVGLRLLLCPISSNVLTRTACFSVGTAFPIYSTFKAIESRDQNEQQKWLIYWAAYGSFSIAEIFADKLLFWIPYYYQMKFVFLVWLQFPSANGARQLYAHHLRPFLVKQQARLDQVVGFVHGELLQAKFVSSHQAAFGFAKTVLTRASLAVRDVINPVQQQGGQAVEDPARIEEISESENKE